MRILALLILAIALTGCGKTERVVGQPAAPSGLSSFHVLPDGGYLEVVRDSGGLYDLPQVRVVVTNADGSKGLLPLSTVSNLPEINGRLHYYANVTYPAGNNVKNDSGNAVLTGSLFTMITISNHNGNVSIRVQISSGATPVFDHTI